MKVRQDKKNRFLILKPNSEKSDKKEKRYGHLPILPLGVSFSNSLYNFKKWPPLGVIS